MLSVQSTAAPAHEVCVRDATRDDLPLLMRLIQDLAVAGGSESQLSIDDLRRDGFDTSPPWFFGLMAESGGEVVGYAICNRAYSSWTGRAYFMEDLYVVPSYRRCGVGRRLLHAVCARALREGVRRVDWHVLEANCGALAFYMRAGARDLRRSEGRAALRLDEDRIAAVAREDLLHGRHNSSFASRTPTRKISTSQL